MVAGLRNQNSPSSIHFRKPCNHPNLYAVLNSGCDRSQAWRSFPSCRLLKTYVGPIPFDGFEPDSISSECGVLPNGFVRGGHRSEHFLSFRYRENAGDSMHAQPHFRTLFHSKYFCNSIDFKNEIERKDFRRCNTCLERRRPPAQIRAPRPLSACSTFIKILRGWEVSSKSLAIRGNTPRKSANSKAYFLALRSLRWEECWLRKFGPSSSTAIPYRA
jgi:hypothetical protein